MEEPIQQLEDHDGDYYEDDLGMELPTQQEETDNLNSQHHQEGEDYYEDDLAEHVDALLEEDEDCFWSDGEEDPIELLLASEHPHKDASMRIGDQERNWALAIKRAVQDSDELLELTDMEYAHYAIIAQGNLQEALRRIYGIQCFKDNYRVDNSPKEGVRWIREMLQQQPGTLLYLDVDPVSLNGFHALDVGAVNFELALSKHHPKGVDYNFQVFVVGMYYAYLAVQPTLQSIRGGHTTMGDFINFEWHSQHVNSDATSRYAGEMFAFFPLRFEKYLAFNTGYASTVAWGMLKNVFPASLMKVLRLGCRIPLEGDQEYAPTLAEKYLQPNLQEAYERLLSRAHELLSLRQKNMGLFRL